MALDMTSACGRCDTRLQETGEAYICTFECTFCPDCTEELAGICQNCGGELVRRPRPPS